MVKKEQAARSDADSAEKSYRETLASLEQARQGWKDEMTKLCVVCNLAAVRDSKDIWLSVSLMESYTHTSVKTFFSELNGQTVWWTTARQILL